MPFCVPIIRQRIRNWLEHAVTQRPPTNFKDTSDTSPVEGGKSPVLRIKGSDYSDRFSDIRLIRLNLGTVGKTASGELDPMISLSDFRSGGSPKYTNGTENTEEIAHIALLEHRRACRMTCTSSKKLHLS